MAGMMSEMAAAVGKEEDAADYARLQDDVREAFQKEFINKKGELKSDSQTAYALAFAYDLVPEDLADESLLHFLRQIQYRAWHLSTGFVGTPVLLPGLSKAGKTDVAYHLLTQETFPSWGYQVKQGATTIWERWDGWTEEFGFQTPAMNSFNHYAFGAVGEWMVERILGIEAAEPGFREFTIRPRPGGGLTFARGHYDSINGRISSEWEIQGEVLRLQVEVPANTVGTIHVPTVDGDTLRENGKPVSESSGLEFLGLEEEFPVFRAGSGRYEFTSRYRPGE
jgi:alpha-L-rhamnosidase